VAVNLAGVHHSEIARGDVLALPGSIAPTQLLDVRLRLTRNAPQPLEQNDPLDLFVGAAEVPCRVTLLDSAQLEPGASGWVQLRLASPVAVRRGDRCIVRQPSPSITVGGGVIVETHPRRHRRFRPEVAGALEALLNGGPADVLLQALGDGAPTEWGALCKAAGLAADAAAQALGELRETGRVVVLGVSAEPVPAADALVLTALRWQQLTDTARQALAAHHQRFPLRAGMGREELRSRLKLTPRATGLVLEQAARDGALRVTATLVALPDHTPTLNPRQQHAAANLLSALAKSPHSPPARAEWGDVDGELLAYLVEGGQIAGVGGDVYFARAAYDELLAWVRDHIAAHGSLTVAQLRDRFDTSRKYALALLEHLDERKITRRVGDARVLY
jgi:selenocysteine-specific elongation factor